MRAVPRCQLNTKPNGKHRLVKCLIDVDGDDIVTVISRDIDVTVVVVYKSLLIFSLL